MDSLDDMISAGLRCIAVIALAILSVVVALLLIAAQPAEAQSRNCGDHTQIVEWLLSGYGETRQSIGIDADGSLVEVFASHQTGTLSLVVTRAYGPSCLVASGEAYQNTSSDNLDGIAPGEEL